MALSHHSGTIEYQGRGTPHLRLAVNVQLYEPSSNSLDLHQRTSEIRQRAKEDFGFQKQLLEYIAIRRCLHMLPMSKTVESALVPFLDPRLQFFDEAMAIDLYARVATKNMHVQNHMPTCFKYSKTRCRTCFSRGIGSESRMDPETGLIQIKRDHAWVNSYNPWIMMMLRVNHDYRFLIHALCTIYYVAKYIIKRQQALHTQPTIATAVRKEMVLTHQQPNPTDSTKSMLVKLYNKLRSHRKVGIPETISLFVGILRSLY